MSTTSSLDFSALDVTRKLYVSGLYDIGPEFNRTKFNRLHYGTRLSDLRHVVIKRSNMTELNKRKDLTCMATSRKRKLEHTLPDDPMHEIQMFKKINLLGGHPNIVQFMDEYTVECKHGEFGVVEYTEWKHQVLEACGCELFKLVSEHMCTIEMARRYFRQLVSAVLFLHTNGIVHLDLAPENVLLMGWGITSPTTIEKPTRINNADDDVKLCDFGLSQLLIPLQSPPSPMSPMSSMTPVSPVSSSSTEEKKINDLASTQEGPQQQQQQHYHPIVKQGGRFGYRAPEIYSEENKLANESDTPYDGRAVDVWALGVILFTMYFGCPPWRIPHDSDNRYKRIVHDRQLVRLINAWKLPSVTPELEDLLGGIFVLDPSKRLTIVEIAAHPFVTGLGSGSSTTATVH